jgi:serine protease
MKSISTFLAFAAALLLVFSNFGFAADNYVSLYTSEGKPILVDNEIIVSFDSSLKNGDINRILKKYKLGKKKNSWKNGKFLVLQKEDALESTANIVEQLSRETGVRFAEQNAYAYAVMVPNDPYYSYQWHMPRIGVEEAWDDSTGSGAVVAINDTGVRQDLADLANTNFMAGYDFINNDSDPTDDEGHGSHVCGTVAQSTNNNTGVVGVAFNCTIMPVKVLNSSGSGTYDQIADGIYYAVDHGADIINMSLSGPSDLTVLRNAINYAWNNGVVIVCAAGNSGSSVPEYPAAYTNSISVSAVNYLDQLADYSNYGSTIDICAPGGDTNDYNGDGYMDGVLQQTFDKTTGDPGYYFYIGTSMASPHVAGVAALVKSANSALTNADIRNILETTAEDLGAAGWDQYFGYGIVDAYAAVQAAGGGNQPPVADFTFTTNLLEVTFTDQSYDPDGTIVSWDWDFGDSTGSTLQNPVHTYAASGTYPVTLTVTDNDGATDYVTKDVTVSDGSVVEMYVFDISMTKQNYFRWIYRARATITIKDTEGNVVPNATVYTSWTGKWTGTRSGTTGSTGMVTLTTPWVWGNGTFTVTVTNVTHATLPYNPALNNETSDSI